MLAWRAQGSAFSSKHYSKCTYGTETEGHRGREEEEPGKEEGMSQGGTGARAIISTPTLSSTGLSAESHGNVLYRRG